MEILSDADRATLEARLVEFDRHWHNGKLAESVGALPATDERLRLPTLVELIKIDLERQWQHGNRVTVASYLARFPELANAQTVVADLVEVEGRVFQQFDATGSETNRGGPFDTVGYAPGGRYRMIRQLGQGNMGSVYLAEDTRLGRQVALKVPHFRPDDGPEVRARFFREARALAALRHPNLCPIFDVGEQHGVPFLIMAYLEGGSLSQALKGCPPWPQHAAAALVRQLALGLAAAHDCGIVHRDLKPANVLLTARNEPVVVDFGLARRAGPDEIRLTGTGSLLGTPAYMAPEQAAGDSAIIGPACDIYSLGVILYELLTGRLPFEGSLVEVLVGVREQAPAPLTARRPDVDPELEAICSRAMAKQPQNRYPAMRDLAAALDHFLRAGHDATLPHTPDPTGLRSLQTVNRGARSGWKSRLAWVAILILAAGFLGLAWWSLSGPTPEITDPPPGKPLAPVEKKTPPAASVKYGLVRSFQRHQGKVVSVAFSAEGSGVVSGGADHTVRFWDVSTGGEKADSPWKLGSLTQVHGLAANGRYVLTSTLQSLSMRQVEGRREVRTFKPGGPHLDAFAVTSDGRRFIGGITQVFGESLVRVWDMEADEPLGSWTGHAKTIVCIALASDGHRAVSTSKDGLSVWEVPTGKLLQQPKTGPVVSLAMSPGGDRFLTGSASGLVRLWETDTGRDLARLDGHTDAVRCLAFSPNGRLALSGGDDCTVRLWDLELFKELACMRGHTAPVTCLAFSPAGDHMLSGSQDGELRLWGPE